MLDIHSIFSEDGLLSRAIQNYRYRKQQVEMADAVTNAIDNNRVLIAEAGTGTGKTFAYLIPAILSGGKVIISTGTKTLQDQLFTRDIPTVRDALKLPVTVALLKGRNNYVCHYYLERTLSDGTLANREDVRYLQAIERYAGITKSGDKSGLSDVPENAAVWSQVTSTRENCLGSNCAHYKQCFVMEARKRALEADVVVVNHHLFFADVMLRDEGVAELLPACNTVIFDEAHQLPQTAALFFGESVSTSELVRLARDIRIETVASAPEFVELIDAAGDLEKATLDLRLAIDAENIRVPIGDLAGNQGFSQAAQKLSSVLEYVMQLLQSQAERSEGLQKCMQRVVEVSAKLKRWHEEIDDSYVRWCEVFNQVMQLNATPLSVAEVFQKQITSTARSWIFTSATLAVKQDFSHYQNELGLADVQTSCWDSPFDYGSQALLYVPRGLPEPHHSAYTAAVIEAALPAIQASGGRAFLLFTTLRAMKEAHELLKSELAQKNLNLPILVQGEGTRIELLERFRRLGNAILLGSQSFWEGVDVRGEALSLVVIDKLPFAPPDDPVLAARIDAMHQQGRNAFMEYQLPHAVITLKQGAGRLIRDETDKGVLMICDPRIITKSYGKTIWRSLPPMRRTREINDVIDFFQISMHATV